MRTNRRIIGVNMDKMIGIFLEEIKKFYVYLLLFPPQNNHYNCTRSAYIHSINLLKELGEEEVNKHKIFIAFTCQSGNEV